MLSPSNADETWESIWACATIPSLAEIVVIASDRMHADVFCRDAKGFWPDPGVVVPAGGIVRLPALGLDMPMEEIYWNVVLGA